MTTTDKMGGYIRARIIETKNIQSFVIIGKNVKITLKPEKDFFEVDAKKDGISPVVSLAKEKYGHIYDINLSISSKNTTDLILKPFNKMIAICTNPMGDNHVFGTLHYPLSGSTLPIISDRPEGETGEVISLSGRQPVQVLTLEP